MILLAAVLLPGGCGSGSGGGGGGPLGVAPASLGFSAAQDGAGPAAQTLTLTNLTAQPLDWTASAAAAWLTVTPAAGQAGTAPVEITVSVDAAGLVAAGSPYSATIAFTSAAGNVVAQVPVTLTLLAPAPAIFLVPGSVMIVASFGGPDPSPQSVTVANAGSAGSTLRWSATGDTSWLSVSPAAGSLGAGASEALTLSAGLTAEAWLGPTASLSAPTTREKFSAVWTGTEMIVWGGAIAWGPVLTNTGGRYDPATDSWRGPTAMAGAPAARHFHTAVWSGTEMIVWGGDDGAALDTGKRYNPATQIWTGATSTAGALPRSHHTAVWTGSEMVVWGGLGGAKQRQNSGARYDPAAKIWTDLAQSGQVPTVRHEHAAVWTGTEMIVWGGHAGAGGTATDTGGRFDPRTGAWTATATAGAPAPRWETSAVWTGMEMIVWGGAIDNKVGNTSTTGGRYSPVTDRWQGTATDGAPAARRSHEAVWTGREMVIWGGYDGTSDFFNSGGRYLPPTGLGTYVATLTVSDPRATNTPQTVTVTLKVE